MQDRGRISIDRAGGVWPPWAKMNIGYARETAGDLSLDEQTARLKAAGCGDVFRETDWKKRAGLWRAVQSCGQGDTLVVVNLVRLASTVRELFNVFAKLSERGAGIRSLSEPWADPLDDSGRRFLTTLAGLAEFERAGKADMMRTMRADAVAKGRARGPKSKLTAAQKAEIMADYKPGVTKLVDLAERHNVHASTISRLVSPPGQKTP